METIIICVAAIIITGIICYTKYKLEGIDHYKQANARIDNLLTRMEFDRKILNEIRDYTLKILTYCQRNK